MFKIKKECKALFVWDEIVSVVWVDTAQLWRQRRVWMVHTGLLDAFIELLLRDVTVKTVGILSRHF
jgi:hypothetical protein